MAEPGRPSPRRDGAAGPGRRAAGGPGLGRPATGVVARPLPRPPPPYPARGHRPRRWPPGQVELGDQRLHLPVQDHRGPAQGPLPQIPLLGGGRGRDVEGDQGPVPGTATLRPGHEKRPAHPFDEPFDGRVARAVLTFATVAIDEEHHAAEGGLALPEPDQGVQLRRRGGNGGRCEGGHVEPQPSRHRRGDRAGAARIAAELDRRQGPLLLRGAGPERDHLVGDPHQGRHRLGLRSQGLDPPGQPVVQVLHADQIVEDPLVDPQPPGGERAARLQLHHAPSPQRGGRRESAPVGAGEGGQGEPEGRAPRPCPPAATASAKPESSSTPAHSRRRSRSKGDSPKICRRLSRAGGASISTGGSAGSSRAERALSLPSTAGAARVSSTLRRRASSAVRYRWFCSLQRSTRLMRLMARSPRRVPGSRPPGPARGGSRRRLPGPAPGIRPARPARPESAPGRRPPSGTAPGWSSLCRRR